MSAEIPKVGIHVQTLPIPSEAFVLEQARSLTKFRPVMLPCHLLGPVGIECRAIQTSADRGLWRRRALAVWPGPWAWGGRAALADLSLIHAHFGPSGTVALPVARALDIPLVVTFHGYDATVRRWEMLKGGGVRDIRFMMFRKKLAEQSAALIAVSKYLKSILIQDGYPEQKIFQHYIGVDLERFQPTPENNRRPEIICVGRLMEAKGIADLIKAFHSLPSRHADKRLVLIGQGQDRPMFERLAIELGVSDRVEFAGTMPHTEVAGRVANSMLSVLFSHQGRNGWNEAFGLASIEAQACGVPSVVSDNGGLPETIVDGQTGIVVPQRDWKALGGVLEELLDDHSRCLEMGRNGRRHVEKNFNLHRQSQNLEYIYAGKA